MQLRESVLTDDAKCQLRPGEDNSCDYMNVSVCLNERTLSNLSDHMIS